MEAKQQFVAREGLEAAPRVSDGPEAAVIGFLLGCEDEAAIDALTPSPHLIGAFLGSGVDDLGVMATIETNHVNILTYGN